MFPDRDGLGHTATDNTHPYDLTNGLNAVGSNELCRQKWIKTSVYS